MLQPKDRVREFEGQLVLDGAGKRDDRLSCQSPAASAVTGDFGPERNGPARIQLPTHRQLRGEPPGARRSERIDLLSRKDCVRRNRSLLGFVFVDGI